MYIKSHHNNYVESYALSNVAFSGNLFPELIWFLSSMYIESQSYPISNIVFFGNNSGKLHISIISLQYVY